MAVWSGYIRRRIMENWTDTARRDAERIAQQAPPTGVAVEDGLLYRPDGEEQHKLNFYYPEGTSGLLPCVVDIHGGGWMYGDRNLNKYFCMNLAAGGVAVMGMGYRLLPDTDLRGQVQDVFDSLHWLAENGSAHHCDMDRVCLTGDSAGGHLTGLVACIQGSPKLQAIYGVQALPFGIHAIAINHGVCQVKRLGFAEGLAGRLVDREMQRMLFGPHPKRASNYNYASFTEVAERIDLPPVMLISSEGDAFHSQTFQVRDYLEKRGADYELLYWTNEMGKELQHVFNIANPHWPQSVETNCKMLAFFGERCG